MCCCAETHGEPDFNAGVLVKKGCEMRLCHAGLRKMSLGLETILEFALLVLRTELVALWTGASQSQCVPLQAR